MGIMVPMTKVAVGVGVLVATASLSDTPASMYFFWPLYMTVYQVAPFMTVVPVISTCAPMGSVVEADCALAESYSFTPAAEVV